MKRLNVSLLSLVLCVSLAQGALAEGTLEKVKKSGVLVAGVLDNSPPFGYMQGASGNIVGYDVDFVTSLATRLGVRVELKAVTAVNRVPQLIDGSVDLVAANLTHSESHARESVIGLSEHYLSTGQKFLTKRGLIKSLKDLWGKKIGAVSGTPSAGCAGDKCQGGTIVSFDDYIQGVQALQKGQIDAFTTDEVILVSLLASLPRGDYEIPDVQISEEQYHLGLRKGDAEFLAFVDKAIRDMQESGELTKLRDKWFSPQEERPPVAYGAVVRKASVRPRFLGIRLKGTFSPKDETSIFGLDGAYLGKGTISSILEDEFYLDVDNDLYDQVRAGFLVSVNMTNEVARGIVIQHQELLRSVKADSEKEAEALRAQLEKEGIEKERRAREIDLMREKSRLTVQEERAIFFNQFRR